MVKVLFANHAQFEGKYTNLGDWAIFETMIQNLTPLIDDRRIEVMVPSSDPQYTNSNYPVKAFQRGGFSGILNTLKAIKSCDICLSGGGEIVQDRSSLVYIPYQLIRPAIAKLFGKKLFAYAIGVGRPDEISAIGKLQAKLILSLFDCITVRDPKSKDVLKNYIGIKNKIYVTADPAINLIPDSSPVNSSPYFVISARSVYHRNFNLLPFSLRKKLKLVPSAYYKEIEQFKTDLASIAQTLSEKTGYNIKFLNTYTGKSMSANDDSFTNSIIKKISHKYQAKVSVIENCQKPCQVKNELKNAEFVLTVPLHPLILGASENTPVFCISYASKNESFMKQVGLSDYIYPVEKIGQRLNKNIIISDVLNVIENKDKYKTDLKMKFTILKNTETQNNKLLIDMINSIKRSK